MLHSTVRNHNEHNERITRSAHVPAGHGDGASAWRGQGMAGVGPLAAMCSPLLSRTPATRRPSRLTALTDAYQRCSADAAMDAVGGRWPVGAGEGAGSACMHSGSCRRVQRLGGRTSTTRTPADFACATMRCGHPHSEEWPRLRSIVHTSSMPYVSHARRQISPARVWPALARRAGVGPRLALIIIETHKIASTAQPRQRRH
jgi:hypothetical protein